MGASCSYLTVLKIFYELNVYELFSSFSHSHRSQYHRDSRKYFSCGIQSLNFLCPNYRNVSMQPMIEDESNHLIQANSTSATYIISVIQCTKRHWQLWPISGHWPNGLPGFTFSIAAIGQRQTVPAVSGHTRKRPFVLCNSRGIALADIQQNEPGRLM